VTVGSVEVVARNDPAAVGFRPLEEFPDFWPGNPMLLLVKSIGGRQIG
jgi:hypothetical protein